MPFSVCFLNHFFVQYSSDSEKEDGGAYTFSNLVGEEKHVHVSEFGYMES